MSSRRHEARHSSRHRSSGGGNSLDKSDRKRRHRIHKAEDLLQRLSHKVVKRRYHLLEDYRDLVGGHDEHKRGHSRGNASKIGLNLKDYPIHKSIMVWNSGDLVAHKHRRRRENHRHKHGASNHHRQHGSHHSSMAASSSHHHQHESPSPREEEASLSLENDHGRYTFPVKHQQANYERFLAAAKALCDDEHLQTIAWMLCNLTSKDPNKEPTAVAYFESPLIPFQDGQKSNLRSMVKFAFTKYNSIVGRASSPHQRLDKNKVVGIVLFNPRMQSAIAYTAQYVRHPGHARIKYRPDCKTLKRIARTSLDEAMAYRWPAIKTLPIKK